jgi:predicted transcriptional regulator
MSEPNEKTLVAQILCSYLSNNTLAPADLPSVIETVKKAFGGWRRPSWGLLSCLPCDRGQATSPSQTVVPRNSAQQSDNRSSDRRWRDTHEGSVDGSFAS